MPCSKNKADDFRIDLLPFKDHPDFLEAPEAINHYGLKAHSMSCG